MGILRFEGGWIWDKNDFVLNEVFDISVSNQKEDRTIRLPETSLLVPGLLDFHCHVWAPGAPVGITDTEYLSTGVIACGDAGTFGYDGWVNADRFWQNSLLDIRSWLSVLPEGITIHPNPHPTPPDNISVERIVETGELAEGRLLGMKVRLGQVDEATDRGLLRVARTAAEKLNLPMMVHLTETFLPIEEVVENLRPGDVLSHPFHGKRGHILDSRGRVSAAFIDAVEQGLKLDIAQGSKHFAWNVFRQALSEGIKPDTISSDLVRNTWKKPAVSDMCNVVSRFISAGLAKEEVFASMLLTGADFMNLPINNTDNLVVLEPGVETDYPDSEGETVTGPLYSPKFHIFKGKLIYASSF
ncbi:hypothetical protein [Paenibacillus hamazuiensis]|uniref:hypothetical protein n=1 Tax=Paenibacillus hamazuiensis TaxID=2936508 RepID=UPI00200E0D2B|nr:hypothetical protein [Paenibacillus hamazuiensis]